MKYLVLTIRKSEFDPQVISATMDEARRLAEQDPLNLKHCDHRL